MVTIKGIRIKSFAVFSLFNITALFLFSGLSVLKAQESGQPQRYKVEILNANSGEYDPQQAKNRLIGNVELRHKDMYMKCDSAWYFDQTNQVYAFNNIHIHQGDTIHIYGKYLTYDGATGKAVLTDSVELVDKETKLFTDKINYDANTQVAQYNTGGRILNGKNILTSKTGIYFSEQKMMHFRDSVKIVNPDYVMHADTLRYNTLSEVIFFEGPSEAKGDSIYLYCEKGWSDTKTDISRLMKNAVIDNRKQTLSGDTLYYDKKKGYGEGFGNVVIADTAKKVTVSGNYAWYYKDPEQFLMTRNAKFTTTSKGDTLTLMADTLKAVPQIDTNGISHRLLRAYHKCKIFSNELQGICDSLSFSFRDSVIRLYTEPVLWSQENQMTADSMALFTKNRAPEKMLLYNNPFVISSVDSLTFNQVKGKNLVGYFKDNKLFKVVITGNCEVIYYVADGDQLIGVDRSKCASIEIYLEESKIKEIMLIGGPEGTIEPPLKTDPLNLRLDGFKWLPEKRPEKGKKS